MTTQAQPHSGGSDTAKQQTSLHIFVNRKKKEESDGVRPVMKGREIAALANVPAENAVVRRGNTGDSPIVGLDDELQIHMAEHFLVTRKIVEGGIDVPPRIARELAALAEAGQEAEYCNEGNREVVIYRSVPTAGGARGLPHSTDVLVPVPSGYPASMIDTAALPAGSPFLGKVKGAPNQGSISANGAVWNVVSYHPHNGGGGPPWDQSTLGFHTYLDELLTWLSIIA